MASGRARHSSLKTRAASGLGGVVIVDRDGALEDDRAGVIGVVGEVDGAAGDLHPVVEHGLVDLGAVIALAAEGGDERRGGR